MDKDILIEDELLLDIKTYCKLNDLEVGKTVNVLLKKSFMEMKWLHPVQPPEPIVVEPFTNENKKIINKEIEVEPTPKPKKDNLYGE